MSQRIPLLFPQPGGPKIDEVNDGWGGCDFVTGAGPATSGFLVLRKMLTDVRKLLAARGLGDPILSSPFVTYAAK